jgi:abortive infection bacteriophage resistance protein
LPIYFQLVTEDNSAPFLTFDERVLYLTTKDYVVSGQMSDASRDFLSGVNFHYFLGYGRNFRKLRLEQPAYASASLDDLVQIVRTDHELSDLVFRALRTLEWRLRSLYVEHHCAFYDSVGPYMQAGTYNADALDSPIHESIVAQIHRSREPFITEHIAASTAKLALSSRQLTPAEQAMVAGDLPIWSTVDSWTFGTLCRAIQYCKRPSEDDEWIWKKISLDLGTPSKMFPQYLSAVQVLRNLIAHHSRLWMRPTTNTPKFPNRYRSERRATHEKSVYVVLLALADLIAKLPSGRGFKQEVDLLLDSNPLYSIGIRQIFTHSSADKTS